MNALLPQWNLLLAWLWIFLGFLSGMVLGLFFHHENWLGGYGSLRRRMYRLGHISFFGLGAVNLLFWLTMKDVPPGWNTTIAAATFIIGAITMPVCCVIMAHFPRLHLIFTVPVVSLLIAGALTLTVVFSSQSPSSLRTATPPSEQQLSTLPQP